VLDKYGLRFHYLRSHYLRSFTSDTCNVMKGVRTEVISYISVPINQNMNIDDAKFCPVVLPTVSKCRLTTEPFSLSKNQ